MSLLIKNIKKLIQCRTEKISFVSGEDMSFLPSIDNAYLFIKEGEVLLVLKRIKNTTK